MAITKRRHTADKRWFPQQVTLLLAKALQPFQLELVHRFSTTKFYLGAHMSQTHDVAIVAIATFIDLLKVTWHLCSHVQTLLGSFMDK